MMRKVSILVIGLFLFTAIYSYAQDDPNSWDFGKVKENVIQKHDFALKNGSSKVLNIKEINVSCGCTSAEVKDKTIPPQESTLVSVKFNPKNFKGDVQQFVYVNTDDVDNPVVRFIIKANVSK